MSSQTANQELVECVELLSTEMGELAFEKIRYLLLEEQNRVNILIPYFHKEFIPSSRTALSILIVSVFQYQPAVRWLMEHAGWKSDDFSACREEFLSDI